MSNRFFVILLALVVVVGGIILFNRDGEESTNVTAEPSSHLYGAAAEENSDVAQEDTVTLVEYGDFQCPACGSYFPILQQLKEQYKDKMTFQFRNFPLVAIHPNAMAAHKAAEAAAKQDKFWEMHDLIYQRQAAWQDSNNPANTFVGYAEELKLNMEQYNADVASQEVNAIIQADIKAGQDLNITGTPGFVLEGEKIENPTSIEEFQKLIDDAIKEKTTS